MDIKIKKIGLYILLAVVFITYFFIRLPELKDAFSIGMSKPGDFIQDYMAGKQLLMGKTLYPSNYREMDELPQPKNQTPSILKNKLIDAHPPFAAILLFPLWFFSFHNAIFLWVIITILCMVLIISLLLKSENIPLVYIPLVSLFVLAWAPFQTNLSNGQISILVTLFVIAGWYFLKSERESLAGIFIALATMLKFYPGLLIIYLLINKKYKAFLTATIGIGFILVLSYLITKNDLFYFIFNVLPGDIQRCEIIFGNASFNGFFTQLFLHLQPYGNTIAFIPVVHRFDRNLCLYVTEALFLLYGVYSVNKYNYDNDKGFSVFIISSLLLSPLCWNHYLTLLLLPLIVFAKELLKKRTISEVVIFLTALFFISIDTSSVYFFKALYVVRGFIPGHPWSFFYRMTFYLLPFYGMVLLLILNFRLIKQTKTFTSSNEH